MTLSATVFDFGNDTHTYVINWGDGTANNSGNVVDGSLSESHTYPQDGVYEATLTVTDSDGATREQSVEVVIRNVAPVAIDDTGLTTDEDTSLAISENVVLGNDTDAGALDTKRISGIEIQSSIGATISFTDGVLTYDPSTSTTLNALPAGQSIVDTFTYTVADDFGDEDTATISITVNGVNDAPVALTDVNTVTGDTVSAVRGNLLVNDSDIDSQLLLTPVGVTVNVGTEFFPVGRLIDDSGLSGVADAMNYEEITHGTHNSTRSWVTDAILPDYFPSGAVPKLTFDLGSQSLLTDIVIWGYHPATGNQVKEFTLEFSTDGGITFGNAISLSKAITGSQQETLSFGSEILADTVRMTITDNHFGTPDAPGGDRVGLGEVKFLTVSLAATSVAGVTDDDVDVAGQFGTLDWNADGTYAYTVDSTNSAVQRLQVGESLVDTFTYTVSDGLAATTSTLSITIQGVNETPVGSDDVVVSMAGSMLSVAANGYDDVVIADQPVAYWRFGESTGTVAANEMSPETPDGSYAVTPNSLEFDGVNSRVDVPFSPELNTPSFTFEAWAKVTGKVGEWRTLVMSRGSEVGFNIYAGTNNRWQFWTGVNGAVPDPPNWDVLTGPTVVLNEWTHIAASFEATSGPDQNGTLTGIKRLYINGELVGERLNAQYLPMTVTRNFTIGRGNGGGLGFIGNIDDVRFWNKGISESDIRSRMQTRVTGREENLVDAWRFDEGSGTFAASETGAHDGSVLGGAAWSAETAPLILEIPERTSVPSLITTSTDHAVRFDGTSLVVVPDSSFINTYYSQGEASAKSFEFLFRADDVDSRQVIYEQGGFSNGFNLYVEAGELYFGAWDADNFRSVKTPIQRDVTYHVVGVFDAPQMTLYVNGQAVGTGTTNFNGSGGVSAHSGAIGIGGRNNDTRYHDGSTPVGDGDFFTGVIDDLALYNTALTAEQVAIHYQSLGLLANDTDVDAVDTRVVTAVQGDAAAVGRRMTLPSGASLRVRADGSYEYDPNGMFSSLSDGETADDTFNYTVTDSQGASTIVPVTVRVMGEPVPAPPGDFGDAPAPYPTLRSDSGAWHQTGGTLILGTVIDSDPDGQPSSAADADDLNGIDDEDGVEFTTFLIVDPAGPTTGTYTVTASQSGKLDAWVDFNSDGDWDDPGEQIAVSIDVASGQNDLEFLVPVDAAVGTTYARFRLSSAGGLTPLAKALDGEVEDYQLTLQPRGDFGDAPAPYPTQRKDSGAWHKLGTPLFLGAAVDWEPDGIPGANADGDDTNKASDEDGVTFALPLRANSQVTKTGSYTVVASAAGLLDAFIDFNQDGDWDDEGEKIADSLPVSAGLNSLTFKIPAGANTGTTFSRIRLSTAGGLTPIGLAEDGEVEDYRVSITDSVPPPTPMPVTTTPDDRQPVLTWTEMPDAVLYEIWFSRISPQASRLFVGGESFVTTNSWQPPVGLDPAVYRFWVRATDSAGATTDWSTSKDFDMKPTLLGPLGPGFERQPTFAWDPIPYATGYELYIRSTDKSFGVNGNLVISDITASETSWTSPTDLPEGGIRWWIRAANSIGYRGWSDAGVTSIGGRTSIVAATATAISWNAVSGAARYILHVENVDSGAVVIREDHIVDGTTFVAETPLPSGNYRAWIKAIDSTNLFTSGHWSRKFDFTVAVVQDLNPLEISLTSLPAELELAQGGHDENATHGSRTAPAIRRDAEEGSLTAELKAERVNVHPTTMETLDALMSDPAGFAVLMDES
ncbi:MAG: VCBS domain-containing protein [Planctomycetaceae bacterium]|nr:VCBS domain-containing protein [Planctomycetaceae bacterium]